jgi:hypothetical protein
MLILIVNKLFLYLYTLRINFYFQYVYECLKHNIVLLIKNILN